MDRCPNCGFIADLSPREKRALENEIERLQTMNDALNHEAQNLLCIIERVKDENDALKADAEELYLYAEEWLCEREDDRANELRRKYAPQIKTMKPSDAARGE